MNYIIFSMKGIKKEIIDKGVFFYMVKLMLNLLYSFMGCRMMLPLFTAISALAVNDTVLPAKTTMSIHGKRLAMKKSPTWAVMSWGSGNPTSSKS